MKDFIFSIFLLTIILSKSFGQGCGLVSGTIDKKTGIETRGAVVNSKDFYSLLVQKRLDSNDSLKYFLFLSAASRFLLTDSLLNSKGNFELILVNGEKIILKNADCKNQPLGLGGSIGFTVRTTELVMGQIVNNPIQKLKVFGILETEFSPQKQKQLQKIIACLKNE